MPEKRANIVVYKKKNILLQHKKILTVLIVMLIAIPVTVFLVLSRQNFFKYADAGAIIQTVEVSPGAINIDVNSTEPVYLSALAYDSFGEAVYYLDLDYEWSMSSIDTVGTITKTSGEITEFIPLKYGCGELSVTASWVQESVTKSIQVAVSDGVNVPNCNPSEVKNPVSWVTEHVSLTADDFYILADGKKFLADSASIEIEGLGPNPPEMDKAQLDVIWTEHGAPMRLLMYITKVGDSWSVTETRTYNGKTDPYDEWVNYDEFQGANFGEALVKNNFVIQSDPTASDSASIHFENLRLEPFLVKIPDSGYYIYKSRTSIPVYGIDPNSVFSSNAYLFKDGVYITDQTNLEFVWSIDNPNISMSTRPECEADGLLDPCPDNRLSLTTTQDNLKANVYLVAVDKTIREIIAYTTFGVNQDANNISIINFDPIKLHGLGFGGDNTNASIAGNLNPLTPVRDINIELEDGEGNTTPSYNGDIFYREDTKDFAGFVVLPDIVSEGSYILKVRSPYYLKKQAKGITSIVKNEISNISDVSLVTGDVNNNNSVDIDDYNLLIDCYSDLLPARNCDDENKKTAADLSDDGFVNADDYNLFLRELSVLSGD